MARTTDNLAANIRSIEDIFRRFPSWAGREAVNFYKDSFRRQAYIDHKVSKWAKRSGTQPKKKRAILVQSGALRRSIRFRVSGKKIYVFTDVPYAQVHNEGQHVTNKQSVGSHQRKGKSGKKHTVKAHSRSRNFKMPQRQFMDIPGQKISALLEKRFIHHISRALKKL